MRIPTPPPATSWRTHKDRGKTHFSAGSYHEALEDYMSALNPSDDSDFDDSPPPPSSDRQVLLSNCVACRLKIVTLDGGFIDAVERRSMCAAALEEAKQVRIAGGTGRGVCLCACCSLCKEIRRTKGSKPRKGRG